MCTTQVAKAGLLALVLTASAESADFTLVPISASGGHVIVGNEIRLQGGGQRVFLHIRLSGWGPARLKAWQAVIESSGYATGIRWMLAPAIAPCTSEAECTAAFGTGSACDDPPGVGVRCTAGFQDTSRADWVFTCCSSLGSVDIATLNYRYGTTVTGSATAADPGVPRYGGTLVLDVPANALGTFTVGFVAGLDTIMQDANNELIAPLNLVAARITVLCQSSADCVDGNACTDDVCNPDGTCSNPDNYEPATDCCRPSDGFLTRISDNNACTTDTCDRGTGVVTHTNVADGTACGSTGSTACDRPDVCLGGACNPNFQPAGTPCGDPANTDCDNPDTCNGSGGCLANREPAGTPCGNPSDTDCTNPDTCNSSGQCLANHAANGTTCSDGLCCTVGERCTNGACGGGASRNCTDAFACTTDVCDEAAAPDCCVNTLNPGSCLIAAVCYAEGTLNPADDCEECNPTLATTAWSLRTLGSLCDDHNPCTATDACDEGGTCRGIVVPAGTGCGDPADTECDNPDTCDEAAVCQSHHEPDGLPCGSPTTDQCDNPDSCDGGGSCDPRYVATGTPCDDGDPRSGNDACDQGVCAGTPIAEAPLVTAKQPRYLLVTPQPPGDFPAMALRVTSPDYPCLNRYIGANGLLVSSPVFRTPNQWGTVLVRSANIIPNTRYEVVAEDGTFVSEPGAARTSRWGDVVGIFSGGQWTDPDGAVQILDALAVVERFRNAARAPAVYRVDLLGVGATGVDCQPDGRVDLTTDVIADLDAFRGMSYQVSTRCPVPCVLEEE